VQWRNVADVTKNEDLGDWLKDLGMLKN